MKKICLALVLVLMIAVPGWATDWYVATTGTNGDGTESSPWVDFSNIVFGTGGVVAGDTIHLFKGQTYESIFTTGIDGTAQSWITLVGDAGQSSSPAIINAGASAARSLKVQNEYWIIRDIKIIPSWNGSAGAAIKVDTASNGHVKIENVTISDGPDQNTIGISVAASSDDFLVDECIISGCWIGIMVDTGGSSGLIQNNILQSNLSGTASSGDSIRVINGNYSGFVLRNNLISDYNADGIDCYGAQNVVVEKNIIHDPDTTSSPDNAIKLGGTGSTGNVCRYNIVYNVSSDSGIYTNGLTSGKIYYNLIYNTYRGIFCSSDSNTIINNSILNCTRGIQVGTSLSGITIRNNIIDGSEYDMTVDTDSTVTGGYNCLVNDSSVSGSGTYTGSSNDLYSTDPLLTPTYHLTRNSPCIDAGTKITGIHDQDDWKDLDGHIIHYGSNPDIGCYEYNTNFIKRWGRAKWNIGRWGRGKWGGARW